MDGWFERKVAQTAEITVGATKPIADDLAARLGARAAYVSNGWDPALATLAPSLLTEPAPYTRLVFTGTFSGVRGSDPRPFLRALRIVLGEAGGRPLQLVLAGRLTQAERDLIKDDVLGNAVIHLGLLPREEALALQRSADALLLLTSRNRSEATGKIFEYLGARRPILALAEDNEAARIVRETNSGVAVAPDDVAAIAGALRRLMTGDLARSFAPTGIGHFSYPAPADRMAELVEEAIALRRAARSRRVHVGWKGG